MKTVTLNIDGKVATCEEGKTILFAANGVGVTIPTLCNDYKLAPYGGCRICTVEITKNKKKRLVTACVYPVEEGLEVKTDTPEVRKIRATILELLLASSPNAKNLLDLAKEYGVDTKKFEAEKTNCILCGLCVRYCHEVKKANAIGFVGRGIERRVVFFPEIAKTVCASCRECFSLCPTAKLPSETDGVSFNNLTLGDFLKVK
ncbi:MAG: 2Fe-2S iron-sulfur cluster-binding protein [Dehalococcoidia bacterium]|jgi:NADH dehydrogenase/NADH:ubiquinone oxidoreductase subunit G